MNNNLENLQAFDIPNYKDLTELSNIKIQRHSDASNHKQKSRKKSSLARQVVIALIISGILVALAYKDKDLIPDRNGFEAHDPETSSIVRGQ